ncbi:MAG: hypothetical protein JJT76_12290 [Clostridiaceae bacterium]|nr:hypothetical protein [Clostridiaceae bacterium]
MSLRNKTILTIMLATNIISMFFNWFGFSGINEIPGTRVLFNPITLLCIVLFLIGVWYPFKKTKTNTWIALLSVFSIIGVKIHTFIFWHYMSGAGKVDLFLSFISTYLAFYIGFIISIMISFLVILLNQNKHFLQNRKKLTTVSCVTAIIIVGSLIWCNIPITKILQLK